MDRVTHEMTYRFAIIIVIVLPAWKEKQTSGRQGEWVAEGAKEPRERERPGKRNRRTYMLIHINRRCRYTRRSTSARIGIDTVDRFVLYGGLDRFHGERTAAYPHISLGPIQFRHPRGIHYPDRVWRSTKEICFIVHTTVLIFLAEIAARTRITPRPRFLSFPIESGRRGTTNT